MRPNPGQMKPAGHFVHSFCPTIALNVIGGQGSDQRAFDGTKCSDGHCVPWGKDPQDTYLRPEKMNLPLDNICSPSKVAG